MSSPTTPPVFRRKSYLLLQDDPPPLSSKGQGVFASLVRSRSTTSLHRSENDDYGGRWPRQDEDPEAGPRLNDRRPSVLDTPQMRSMRLIGSCNPRYRWERYWKTNEQLKALKKPIRRYYERTNLLIQQYIYIDRLLDSSLPHNLLNEYDDMPASSFRGVEIPATINEEPRTPRSPDATSTSASSASVPTSKGTGHTKVKRTPKDIYRPTETTPLFSDASDDDETAARKPEIPLLEDDEVDSGAHIVTVAIYVNFAANALLLAGKMAVVFSVPSVSVLASLVDAILDFLSTAIVWTTTWLISRQDQHHYPVGRRRLEPLGVLVFSVIMITSFVQVMLEAIQRLLSPDRTIIELGIPALAIMLGTIFVKGLCWLWCRLVKNSSVQALASDAATDVIFNAGSIAFPIVGFYARLWWLDALGGLLLSMVVIFNWSKTSAQHIKHLSGFSATADQRNILLYLTMRFAKTIKQIQGLQAYHAGDKLNVEVDIVLDASTSLKDSHDLSESLQYVLESVPIVDRAFVHADYASYNLPTHMQQQPS